MARRPWQVWMQARASCALVRHLQAARPAGQAAGVPLGRAGALAMSLALPWLSRRLNLLPSIFFETGPSIGEWA
jgi:hypothetical protein